jgi:hypothetical protein
MPKPTRFEQQDYQVDAEVGNRLFEVKAGETSLRNIRTSLMQLAYAMAKRPGSQGILVLPDVKVTKERLFWEWQLATSVLQPDLVRRLSLCIEEGGRFIGIPRDPDQETQDILTEIIRAHRPNASSRQASVV